MISILGLFCEKPIYDGVQRLYKFENGYGASLVRHSGSYGSSNGLWEIAVIKWTGACEYFCVIPVNKTYDIYEQREIAEKIIRDEFYKWKAEKEGI